jgi:hypothetical protein
MSRPPDERRLQAFFHELAARDRAMAPPFAEVGRPKMPRAGRGGIWAVAAGLALAAGVAGAVMMIGSARVERESAAFDFPDFPAASSPLVEWESPTAYLLEVSYDVAEAGVSPASRSATGKQDL